MTTFIILCAVLVLATVLLLARPLLRKVDNQRSKSASVSFVVVVVAVPTLAALVYLKQSNWSWNQVEAIAEQTDAVQMVGKLEERLQRTPDDLDGWLLLGGSYRELGVPQKAQEAFQKAFDLSRGENSAALFGLAESMAMTDPESLRGRAGELFEGVLQREPANPGALWYGAIAALSRGELALARDRLGGILKQNPPENIRTLIERQMQDIEAQLSEPGEQPAASAANETAIDVRVTLGSKLKLDVDPATTVFVLARDPENPGPPLAVSRRTVKDLPLSVRLSDRDAMLAGRGISTVKRVQIVARISKSGTPQAQPGDYYGEANVTVKLGKTPSIQIVIDRKVEQ